MAITAGALVAHALKYVGYLEKKSNNDLDHFTKNAGSNNYTRFGRDFGLNPAQWCGMFVSMVFVEAFGKENAKRLLCGGLHSYTPTGASYFKSKNQYIKRGKGKPKVGDVIFFYSSAKGRIGHVGIVTKVTASKVYTVEGNTSGANKLVTNGGGVCEKSYNLTSSYIDGYGRVKYDDEKTDTKKIETEGKNMIALNTLRKGDEGKQVKTVQRLLLAMGYKLPEYGADGDFGDETVKAVKEFQKANKLKVDGIVGANTWCALLK